MNVCQKNRVASFYYFMLLCENSAIMTGNLCAVLWMSCNELTHRQSATVS